MQIVLVDDEKLQIQQMTKLIHEACNQLGISATITSYESGETFLFDLPDHPEWELVFLDIQMPNLTGMDLAHYIHKKQPHLQIVFATAYADYAVESYQVEALSYLLKPIQIKDIKHVLNRYQVRLAYQPTYLLVESEGDLLKIDLATIIYAESQGHDLNIYTENQTITINWTLAEFMDQVDNRFIKTHRSYRVNLDFIQSIHPTEALLTTGEILPIARRQVKQVQRAFIDYFKGEVER